MAQLFAKEKEEKQPPPPAPASSPGIITLAEVQIQGSLSAEQVRRVIRSRTAAVRDCYEARLSGNPSLQGRVMLRFVINDRGHVARAEISESTMKDKPVEDCLVRQASSWIFPAPDGVGVVIVNYPFVFKSAD